MDRETALADFDAARKEWEDAFARVPDPALTYRKPGDDYSLGGLQVHVNWVLAHYRRVLEGIVRAGFEQIGPQDPAGAEAKALEGARRGLTPTERHRTLDETARLHAAVRAAVRDMPAAHFTRKALVVYAEGEDPDPTCAEDVV